MAHGQKTKRELYSVFLAGYRTNYLWLTVGSQVHHPCSVSFFFWGGGLNASIRSRWKVDARVGRHVMPRWLFFYLYSPSVVSSENCRRQSAQASMLLLESWCQITCGPFYFQSESWIGGLRENTCQKTWIKRIPHISENFKYFKIFNLFFFSSYISPHWKWKKQRTITEHDSRRQMTISVAFNFLEIRKDRKARIWNRVSQERMIRFYGRNLVFVHLTSLNHWAFTFHWSLVSGLFWRNGQQARLVDWAMSSILTLSALYFFTMPKICCSY